MTQENRISKTNRKIRRLVTIAFFAGALLAGAAMSYYDTGSWFPCKKTAFPVEISVDFGPVGRSAVAEKIYVERGTSPKEALSQVLPILSGKSCCSFREILAVDGVAIDPAQNRWWKCRLNGSYKVSAYRTKLRLGDKIEWQYLEEKQ